MSSAKKSAVHETGPLNRRKHRAKSRGVSTLMYASQQGDVDRVRKIIRAQSSSLFNRDRTGKSALHYCCTSDNIRAAQAADLLVMAAPDLVEGRDEDGFTPLHLAVIAGNMQLVTFLLANNADVNAVDNEKHTVVHWATVCGETAALRAVLAAGAPVSTPDVHRGYPLHYAAQMCGGDRDSSLGLQVLQALLSHKDIVVSVNDGDKRQPLLWAASAGSAKAVLALVRAGAAVESSDKDGLTALHCAASRGHTDCLDTLLTLCGASPDVIDTNGCTALHYAVTLGHADATALLLAHGADPNRQDRKGRSPAHCGCAKGQFETVKLIGSHRANLWLRNARGDLPLHEAAGSGRRELVKWLLEMRPSQVNARNNDGRCPLHMAALNDNADMCKILLDAGAQVNPVLRTSKNIFMTPLDCALQRGFRSTAKYLQLHGGVPANRLGDPRNQSTNSALQIRNDVSFWGDSSSDSERENNLTKVGNRLYKKKLIHKNEHKKASISESDLEDGRRSSSKLQNIENRKKKFSERTRRDSEKSKNTRTDRSADITSKQSNNTKLPSSRLDYTNEIIINGKTEINIHQTREIIIDKEPTKTSAVSETVIPADVTTTQPVRENDRRPRSAKYSKLREKSARSSIENDTRSTREKIGSPVTIIQQEKREKELRKQLTLRDQSTNTSEETTETIIENKNAKISSLEEEKEANIKEEKLTAEPQKLHDQQSLMSNTSEDVEEHKNFIVEASVHEPPKPRQNQNEQPDEDKFVNTQIDEIKAEDDITNKSNAVQNEEKGETLSEIDIKDNVSKTETLMLSNEEVKQTENGQQINELKPEVPEANKTVEIVESVKDENDSNTEIVTSDGNLIADEKLKTEMEKFDDKKESNGEKHLDKTEKSNNEEIISAVTQQPSTKQLEESKATLDDTHNEVNVLNEACNDITTIENDIQSKNEDNNVESPKISPDFSEKNHLETEIDQNGTTVNNITKETPVSNETAEENEHINEEKTKEQRKESVEPVTDAKKESEVGTEVVIEESKDQRSKNDTSTKDKSKVRKSEIPKKKREIKLKPTKDKEKVGEQEQEKQANDYYEYSSFSEDSSLSTPTRKTHKSFRVLDDRETKKLDKRKSRRSKTRKTSAKGSRSRSIENKVKTVSNERGRMKRSKIPTPLMKNNLSKSDKHLDKSFKPDKISQSNLDARVPSLPNIHDGKDHLKEPPRSESNLSAPLLTSLYSDNERDTVSDLDEKSSNMGRNKRRIKKRQKTRESKSAGSDYESSNLIDSGFEPSPRSTRIPRWKNMTERGVNMTSVTQSIQSNIRRYHLERKIFQHLLELKRLQIRAGQHNEIVLVKRAIDAYHQSCASTVGAGRYIAEDYTFKSFEKFLYESLRKLQKNGVDYMKGLPEAPTNPLLCTRSTNRCMHATHAYTGVPCAAYLPKMDHHTIPKIGFNSTTCKPGMSFLPNINSKKAVTLELTHGADKQIISLPADRLDQNKRYYVTFTVNGQNPSSPNHENDSNSSNAHRHSKSD